MQPLLNIILRYKKPIAVLYFIFPVLAFLFPSESISLISENRLSIVLVLNYYLSFVLFATLMRLLTREQIKNSVRSPFHFIRQFNLTYTQDPPLRYLVGAEIGVLKGGHAQQILNGYLNIEKLVLVDAWVPFETDYGMNDGEFDNLYAQVKELFNADKRVEIIRDYSVNAATKFNDDYFDFVYLDGNHEYEFVLKDLEVWYPKLRQYGVMCGDDFGHPSGRGVVKAVSEFAHKYKLLVFSEGTQFWFVKV